MTSKRYFTGGRAQFNNTNDFKYRLEGLATSAGLQIGVDGTEEYFKNGATILNYTVNQITAPNGNTEYHLMVDGVELATSLITFVATTGVTSVTPTGGEEIVAVDEGLNAQGGRIGGSIACIMSFSVKVEVP